ncbi:hypothetical protein ANN_07426 [Periplaneta americana]|uniref:Uncharacterized protein n=1 Tax=Periplaneta americana TaxID=6978 RepID=A0ABQ8SYK1_PERAM|nr:hypothetical protein ANN_07426 [Periplaneta americana]
MTALCEDGNEPPGSLKAIYRLIIGDTDLQLRSGMGLNPIGLITSVVLPNSSTFPVKNYVVSVKCVVSVKKYVVSVKCAVHQGDDKEIDDHNKDDDRNRDDDVNERDYHNNGDDKEVDDDNECGDDNDYGDGHYSKEESKDDD